VPTCKGKHVRGSFFAAMHAKSVALKLHTKDFRINEEIVNNILVFTTPRFFIIDNRGILTRGPHIYFPKNTISED